MAGHPALGQAAREAIEQFGVGSGASRLICGSLQPHHELESALAKWQGTESALVFSTGFAAAQGVLTSLLGRGDVVILDKKAHASMIDGAKLSGATLRVFRHNDLENLEKLLQWAADRGGRVLVASESVFSMDGDHAPLAGIVELKERYGAWLMLDEAHAVGLYGPLGQGLAAAGGLGERIEIRMGTLGKAVGAAGGFICGSRQLVDLLVNKARSFIFSTAPSPAVSAAARAGVELIQGAEGAVTARSALAACGRVEARRRVAWLENASRAKRHSATDRRRGSQGRGHDGAFARGGIFHPGDSLSDRPPQRGPSARHPDSQSYGREYSAVSERAWPSGHSLK